MHIPAEILALLGWWIFSAAIQALPEPLPLERWYGALYRFLHILGANMEQSGLVKKKQ